MKNIIQFLAVSCIALYVVPVTVIAKNADTIVVQPKVAQYTYDAIPKDPLASAMLSATLPGSGQIYNKEYARGVITGVTFYASLIGWQYLLFTRLSQLNSDTFLIAEAYPQSNGDPARVHQAVAPKPANEQVGLPDTEKALLIVSLTACAGAYIFGILDSYRGAIRYNNKLYGLDKELKKTSVQISPTAKGVAVSCSYRF